MIQTYDEMRALLLETHYATEEDFAALTEEEKKDSTTCITALYRRQILTPALFGQAMAEHYKTRYVNLNVSPPSREHILMVPEDVAKQFSFVIVFSEDGKLQIATDNPDQEGLTAKLEELFPGNEVTILYTLTEELEDVFIHYRPPLQDRFQSIIEKKESIASGFLSEILEDALSLRASDIHFEPLPSDVLIRLRIDGVLQEAGRISKEHYENMVNRMKVQANLRIDEHKACQDGAIRMTDAKKAYDLRVSIIPTLDGEKVCVRVLAQYIRGISVSSLGLSPENEATLIDAIHKPFGMILVVGPTGSGKSTTLYALLKILHKSDVNITTIEDPVEYKIPGVNQIQVNAETGITFAAGLRSVARQDPDVILVGEIRDEETADIAVNAALTGHLLLSTFHANDAATAIPRVLDMGVEPFLVASSLELIIAQRLVRTICPTCRYSYSATVKDLETLLPEAPQYFSQEDITLYRGKGCESCNNTGFKGRTALFEFIRNTAEMQDLTLHNPSMKEIALLARKQGALSMFEDGLLKVKKGQTTLEELLRVAQPPSTTLTDATPTS
ncbi:hypothetical protein COW46_01030 [Candidatus Gracilibacteria bacterium CG17_big_fil_post_rev_8_21_14_2_50_48_13]|nr:MAG: hypothetical protein COW46_01030 [Candidatus Gracilibacteria bacterium CG17_big_fil_post_rev_8_21_14_2_50_48_13]